MDLYGRRDPLQGAVTGIFGEVSDVVTTLREDIIFERCDSIEDLTPCRSARSHCTDRAVATGGGSTCFSVYGCYLVNYLYPAHTELGNGSSELDGVELVALRNLER